MTQRRRGKNVQHGIKYLTVFILLLLVGCTAPPSSSTEPPRGPALPTYEVLYYSDINHEVGLWVVNGPNGPAMAVLPWIEYKNPEYPIKLVRK